MASEISLGNKLVEFRSIHILGAGLNKERNAHSAVSELAQRGWRAVPIHPRDAGATISGVPIRDEIENGVEMEVIVLFLAPQRAQDVVRNLLIKNPENPPLVWFQPGAEDDMAISWLNDAGWQLVYDDCIVEFSKRHDLIRSSAIFPWFRQVQYPDDSGCSFWSVHESSEESALPSTKLEWVGDLLDLELSNHVIPRYVRSLVLDGENIEECARRLAK